jgi:hypothetical protein
VNELEYAGMQKHKCPESIIGLELLRIIIFLKKRITIVY